jgi:hypothetical protein
MIYYKDTNTTTSPTIPNVINPTQDTILANGWKIYIDVQPTYDPLAQKVLKTDVVINGDEAVQQYIVIDLTPEEIRELTVPMSITNGQGKMQLLRLGLYEQVEALIMQSGTQEKIYWNDWDNWRRDSPIIQRLAPTVGMTDEDLDQFFIEAAKLV